MPTIAPSSYIPIDMYLPTYLPSLVTFLLRLFRGNPSFQVHHSQPSDLMRRIIPLSLHDPLPVFSFYGTRFACLAERGRICETNRGVLDCLLRFLHSLSALSLCARAVSSCAPSSLFFFFFFSFSASLFSPFLSFSSSSFLSLSLSLSLSCTLCLV
jgi:hypothetical protein